MATTRKPKKTTKIEHQWEHICPKRDNMPVVISHAIHFCPFCKRKKP